MAKLVKVEIVTREQAGQLAHIMGESSAAAAALRALSSMGGDAENFEICRDIKAKMLILIDKKYLTDPRLSVTNGDRQ
jgi:hypothetical protein